MNKTKYMQTDSRWSQLGYPKKPCTIGKDGCGMVSVCNAIIEMQKYVNYTPKTIQPYCKQYAASNCDGTYWSGIPKMMKNYGLTEVKEHQTMDSLWKELKKGNRVAIYLMGSRPGGSKKVHWTSGGHFICSVDYRYKDNDHQVYVKDSYSNASKRNGWCGYKTHLKGDVSAVWSGKLTGKLVDGTTATEVKGTSTDTKPTTSTTQLVVDGIGGKATVKRMEQFFGTTQDGVISGQLTKFKSLYPSLQSVSFGSGGSACIAKLQVWLGLSDPDGYIGSNTTKAWQKKLVALGYLAKNEKIDGIFGVKSMKAWQECLNNNGKKKSSPTPTPTPTKDIKVVDVSAYQDSINWTKAKADGIKGAIVRCGFRGYETGKLQTDSMFLNHIKGAYKAGLPVGIYMFTEAKTEKEGREEADYAIKLWQTAGVPLSFPIAVDTEASGGNKDRCKNLTKAQRTNAIKGFCEQIKKHGYTPMIYASTSWLNNKLDMSKLPYDVWVAQYNTTCDYKGKYIIWQYSSKGSVNGIKGNVDMNKCYYTPKEYKYKEEPKPTPTKQGYTGKFPEYKLVKTNAQVIADAVEWAKKIAKNNDFHYGHGDDAHHNGCYYCGTQKLKKGHGIKMYETTYCCNAFVGAAWAHGGGDAQAYKLCHNCNSWGFAKNDSPSYEKSSLFDKVSTKSLKVGDVLCSDSHVALYAGDGKVVQAGHEDDNKINSPKWNSSISVSSWGGYKRAYRYNGMVSANRPLTKGELSDRVGDLQKYLVWYGEKISETRFFNTATYDAVVKFQEKEMGNGQGDGIVGEKTIQAMKNYKK